MMAFAPSQALSSQGCRAHCMPLAAERSDEAAIGQGDSEERGSGILKLPLCDEGDEVRIGWLYLAKSLGLPTIAWSVIDTNQL
jgi:hypothetical protein